MGFQRVGTKLLSAAPWGPAGVDRGDGEWGRRQGDPTCPGEDVTCLPIHSCKQICPSMAKRAEAGLEEGFCMDLGQNAGLHYVRQLAH